MVPREEWGTLQNTTENMKSQQAGLQREITHLRRQITTRKRQGLQDTGGTTQAHKDGTEPTTSGDHSTPSQLFSPETIVNTEKRLSKMVNGNINKPDQKATTANASRDTGNIRTPIS